MVVHGRSGDLESYLLADKVFHRTLLEASGNEMFRALNGVVAEVFNLVRFGATTLAPTLNLLGPAHHVPLSAS